jgi:uncharacterized OsmC-like protein
VSDTAPTYVSNVSVRRLGGLDKAVRLPAEPDVVVMGGHSKVAEHYGVVDRAPRAATLDYVVGATAACLAGTFAAAMRARGVELDDDYAVTAEGELNVHDGILMVDRIRVVHRLRIQPDERPIAERVIGVYERGCAVSRSLRGAFPIESTLEFLD